MCGRAFMYGVAALGPRGGEHVAQLLLDDLRNNMSQLGCRTVQDLRDTVDDRGQPVLPMPTLAATKEAI